jgi:RNA polymerase sigma-70 factor (ECF subfamily)
VIAAAAIPKATGGGRSPGKRLRPPESHCPVNDDQKLVRRIDACDRDSFAELYDRYGAAVYGICKRILKNPEAAEDVTQSVFTMLWTKPGSFAGGNFAAWITRVARNAALDVLRSAAVKTREPEFPQNIPAPVDLDDEVFSALRADAIQRAMDQLPAEQREAIEHAYFGGLSYREVAARLGAPLGTVKSRIRSGLAQLWQALHRQVAP